MSGSTARVADSALSREIHDGLDFPVIDADGHFLEFSPLFQKQVEERVDAIAGPAMRDKMAAQGLMPFDLAPNLSLEEHRRMRIAAKPWWGWPTGNVHDRATAHLPELLYERLDEFGIDFTFLYPSHALAYSSVHDADLAQAICRAINEISHDEFKKYSDRMTTAALVPMHSPETAIEELEYAVEKLGFKAILISGHIRRPVPSVHEKNPELFPQHVYYLDTYGLDSPHNFDPFWQRCLDLKVAPVTHSGQVGERPTRSVSSYMFNHISCLADGHVNLAKSLFLGGVTERFPTLKVGFLEGGVGWACSLLADLIGHWSKRNRDAMHANLDPRRLDLNALGALVGQYGDEATREQWQNISLSMAQIADASQFYDEWAASGITREQDIVDKFVPNFYFGCEGDDPITAWAFQGNPYGARLRAMFSSDIGHWDVPEMNLAFAEAHEAVEKGRITDADFKDFVFLNAARLHTGMNPDIFSGTNCEVAIAQAFADGDFD
jgi:predicted TIM-barrel fold metal-dependent hydrolase